MVTVTKEPFPALRRLWLESNDWLRLDSPMQDFPMSTLPDTFLGGLAPCLQHIHIDGIPFPAAPVLLLSARDLVLIDLRHIPSTGYISPGTMVTSLATLPRLKYLTLRFLWAPYPGRIRQPPTTRTVLPALTTFDFGGHLEYLEDSVSQIDTPQVECLGIEYFYREGYWGDEDIDFQIPQLCQFIDRSRKLYRFRRAFLEIEFGAVIIEVDEGGSSFKLFMQNTGIYQMLSQISGMLFKVDRLFISSGIPEYRRLGHGLQWLELLYPFATVKALIVQEEFRGVLPMHSTMSTGRWPLKCRQRLKCFA